MGKKRFVKGRVLKQKDNGHGYMFVQFCPNGKHVHLYVHRMVATCFIPNPNNLPEVNHKDNDPTNNVVSNLEWCDRQYNSDYKKNFGTSSTEVLGRLVFAVNLKTGKILCFKSQNQAARQLRVNHGDINSVIKGKLRQAGGYCFTEDESEITEEKIRKIKDKMRSCPVIAINPETSEVLWFESQREAGRQLGIHQTSIVKVVKGKQNKAGGWLFTNVDENAVEKTREKFGDDVAKKVKKLMSEA